MLQGLSIPSNIYSGRLDGDDPIEKEMKILYKKNLAFDNKPAIEIVRSAAQKSGVDPALLFSSSFQEGFNKAIAKPDEVSEAFLNAQSAGLDTKNFPVDGFYNYGLDTFGNRYEQLKKYLPEGFDQRFTTYKAKNEKNEDILTAAFRTNEDALIAKGAFLRSTYDWVDNYAKKKGITLDPETRNYFTLAAYNGGEGNAKMMLDEYAQDADQKTYASSGRTKRKGVHTNITPRLKRMQIANQLLNEK